MEAVFLAKENQQNPVLKEEALECLKDVFIKRRTGKLLLKGVEGNSRTCGSDQDHY